jgi:hypothetical protein
MARTMHGNKRKKYTTNKIHRRKEEKRMKNNSEKPSTLTAALYVIGLIICGYFIVKAIVTL